MSQPISLSDTRPVALITGAGKRIGHAVAHSLHDCGYDLLLHYRHSHSEIKLLVEQLNQWRPSSAVAIAAELTQPEQLDSLVQSSLNLSNNISVLINNASLFSPDSEIEDDYQGWQEMLQVNAHAGYQLTQGLKDILRENQGCVINFVDIYSERPLKGHTLYSTSKAAQAMLVKSMANELAPDVRVNGISPGAIMWPEHQTQDLEYHQQLLAKIPLNRLGSTDDICAAVKFIIECQYLTGQIINIDGGRSIQI